MALFARGKDINEGVREWKGTEGGILIDVRAAEDYRHGHIPGSVGIPFEELGGIGAQVPDTDTPLFVHCYAGVMSGYAVQQLERLGYTDVRDIGGIQGYRGELEA